MTRKEITGGVIVAVVVGLLGLFGGKMLGTYERGTAANTEDQVKKVLNEVLDERLKTTIGGETKTVSEALSMIHEKQVRTEEALKRLTE